jgi:hypothetical protein
LPVDVGRVAVVFRATVVVHACSRRHLLKLLGYDPWLGQRLGAFDCHLDLNRRIDLADPRRRVRLITQNQTGPVEDLPLRPVLREQPAQGPADGKLFDGFFAARFRFAWVRPTCSTGCPRSASLTCGSPAISPNSGRSFICAPRLMIAVIARLLGSTSHPSSSHLTPRGIRRSHRRHRRDRYRILCLIPRFVISSAREAALARAAISCVRCRCGWRVCRRIHFTRRRSMKGNRTFRRQARIPVRRVRKLNRTNCPAASGAEH